MRSRLTPHPTVQASTWTASTSHTSAPGVRYRHATIGVSRIVDGVLERHPDHGLIFECAGDAEWHLRTLGVIAPYNYDPEGL